MIAKIAGFLFFLSAAGVAAGIAGDLDMVKTGIWVQYSSSFFASFVGAYSGNQKHSKSNPGQAIDKEFLSKVYLLAGGLGVVLFGLYDAFFLEGNWDGEHFFNPFMLVSFMAVGFFTFFCASLFYDGNTPSRREKEENAPSDNNGSISFFLSFAGTFSVALFFAVFVLFQETIPDWSDDYLHYSEDDFQAVLDHGNFLSYLSENHLGHLPWALLAILALSFIFTANRKKIPFPPKSIFSFILAVGSFVLLMNTPLMLIYAWQPYIWFWNLALFIALVAGGKILKTK